VPYVPNQITARLATLGMSQASLARTVGIDQSRVSLLVRGLFEPGVRTALRIAEALGTTVEALWPHNTKDDPFV